MLHHRQHLFHHCTAVQMTTCLYAGFMLAPLISQQTVPVPSVWCCHHCVTTDDSMLSSKPYSITSCPTHHDNGWNNQGLRSSIQRNVNCPTGLQLKPPATKKAAPLLILKLLVFLESTRCLFFAPFLCSRPKVKQTWWPLFGLLADTAVCEVLTG